MIKDFTRENKTITLFLVDLFLFRIILIFLPFLFTWIVAPRNLYLWNSVDRLTDYSDRLKFSVDFPPAFFFTFHQRRQYLGHHHHHHHLRSLAQIFSLCLSPKTFSSFTKQFLQPFSLLVSPVLWVSAYSPVTEGTCFDLVSSEMQNHQRVWFGVQDPC